MKARHPKTGFICTLIAAAYCTAGCSRTDHGNRSDLQIENVNYHGAFFTVVTVKVDGPRLELFWRKPDGSRYANFATLRSFLSRSHRKLLFATNSGIFDPAFIPRGLHVEDGKELVPLNLDSANGNFYLKPNGVLSIGANGAQIVESSEYSSAAAHARLAIQSGPLLVNAGNVHHAFQPDSDSRKIRSGVGVLSSGEVVFVLSRGPVNFYEFALFFCDRLRCRNALYLDGAISQFYLPNADAGPMDGNFAGIIGVTDGE